MTNKDPNLIKTPINETAEQAQPNIHTDSVSTKVAATEQVPANTVLDTEPKTDTPNIEDAGKLVNTEHVNEGDLEARSTDRRDQVGQPFDGSINEQSFGKDSPQSEDLDTFNRYANVDNAQTRVLSLSDQQANRKD